MASETEHSVTSPAISSGNHTRVRGLPSDSDLALMELGLIAKSVCSGLHVSKRSLDDIVETSVRTDLSNGGTAALDISVSGQVTAEWNGQTRTAIDTGAHGCVLLPIGAKDVFFEPMLDQDARRAISLADHSDPNFIPALDAAFQTNPDTGTAAVAIVHKGKLVAERYGAGAEADMRLESWSMGKSAVGLLIACAVSDGLLSLDEPIALREWLSSGDPRRAITFDDALRMSSGIDFSAPWAEDYEPERHGYPDHGFIYSGAIDIRALAASRTLLHPPGRFGAYKNGDTLLLLAGLEDRLVAAGEDPLAWPYTRLLYPAGANGLIFETDPYGHIFGTGNVYGTARDWLALGRLFVEPAHSRKIGLDRDVLSHFASPSPAWRGKYWMAEPPTGFSDSVYGLHVWLNRHAPQDRWPAPDDMFFFLGVGGQYTFIVPSLDLAVVRLGHIRKTLESDAGRGHVPALLEAACRAAEAKP
ncbi:MAG: serine hydrolase [Pseudomonadota bacterium]